MSDFIDQNNPTPRVITSALGVQRDGTLYKSQHYIDGQHVRFFHEWAEKMGGYELIDIGNEEIVGSMFGIQKSVSNDVYLGRPSSLSYFNINNANVVSPEIDRTPVLGFVPDPNNLWSFTGYTTDNGLTAPSASYIVAQVAPNRGDIASQSEGPIFIGDANNNAALTQVFDGQTIPGPAAVLVSGGVISLGDILVAYGNNGVIRWTDPGEPGKWPSENSQTIAPTKIVYAIEYFGSLLFWSLSSLIRATYVPANPNTTPPTHSTFQIQVLSNNISILSSKCVSQYNQLVFWVGNGQFYIFNGSVGRLQNYMSNSWFFDSVNRKNLEKCFTWVNTKFDEIWFMYPRDDRQNNIEFTECNAAVIHNVGRATWYDTKLNRSAALTLPTYEFPLLASSTLFTTVKGGIVYNTYPIWRHEQGVDLVDANGNHLAIDSFFEYSIYDLFSKQPSSNNNRLIQTMRVEPDFIINEDMEIRINNRMYANDAVTRVGPITFDGTTRFIDSVISQGRLVSMSFRSNVVGGYYAAGKILHDIIAGDIQS